MSIIPDADNVLSLKPLKPLIIGRGPVRLEALEVFAQYHVETMGILLSRKDSIYMLDAQAPELRCLPKNCGVHYVDDYLPQNVQDYVNTIYGICQSAGYNSIFAGYGFLAEDYQFVYALEQLGLKFIGPSAAIVRQAGAKDAAKNLALAHNCQVVPGITIGGQAQDPTAFETNAEIIIADYLTAVKTLFAAHPGYDLRIKAIFGGGGKGQRIIHADDQDTQLQQALRAVWQEVGVNSPGANKTCVIELNLPSVRHWEIQLVGNGDWCLALGGRDCSLQYNEQKLVEFSLTQAGLSQPGNEPYNAADAQTLALLEAEALAFGSALKLDSVSTYEAIVAIDEAASMADNQQTQQQQHFFMEMNTRLQVEHRVTELVFDLVFTLPDNPTEEVVVTSLVHLMCLIAVAGTKLPKPRRRAKAPWSLEVRLNATNAALKPAVGGIIHRWSPPVTTHLINELRDDQGLSRYNPDTGLPLRYAISGAYDANLALLCVSGVSFQAVVTQMISVLNTLVIEGENLELNQLPLLGILSCLSHKARKPLSTQSVFHYLSWIAQFEQAGFMAHKHFLASSRTHSQTNTLEQLQEFQFHDPNLKSLAAINDVLDPPLSSAEYEVLAPSGGCFFAKPHPQALPFIVAGATYDAGSTLGIVEVMKMFNPILTRQDVIIETIHVNDGDMIHKGQLLFTVKPYRRA